MNGHWYVIAGRDQVKVLSEMKAPNRFRMVKTITNSLGRLRNQDLKHPERGQTGRRLGGKGPLTYVGLESTDPHEDAAIQFARQIGQYLESELNMEGFYGLTVIAEPKFLGMLRRQMSGRLKQTVEEWVAKDLQKLSLKDLEGVLLRPVPRDELVQSI